MDTYVRPEKTGKIKDDNRWDKIGLVNDEKSVKITWLPEQGVMLHISKFAAHARIILRYGHYRINSAPGRHHAVSRNRRYSCERRIYPLLGYFLSLLPRLLIYIQDFTGYYHYQEAIYSILNLIHQSLFFQPIQYLK